MAKFKKWEKLWQDGKNEYLRKSHVSTEIYIKGCDIPLIHFYAEPIDQSVDYAKKLIQKRIGHYREDPLAKKS